MRERKAFVLAAGLGTRLRPWTLEHPKALVPVCGVPMLRRVIGRLQAEGFGNVTVNVHHFADQIKDFLAGSRLGVRINISDESAALLDTGGALLHASEFLAAGGSPFLVHNVDILSDAPLAEIMDMHAAPGRHVSLVTSPRQSSRRLAFDDGGVLRGWHNILTDEMRPARFHADDGLHERAFSGIYVVNPEALDALRAYSRAIGSPAFPIMDFFMHNVSLSKEDPYKLDIGEIGLKGLNLIDIGKPETLSKAESLLGQYGGLSYQ